MQAVIKMIREAFRAHSTPRFKLGMILLLVNPVIGLVVSPCLIALFTWIKNTKTGVTVGGSAYLFSWGLLGAGVFLAGKDGYRIVKSVFKEIKLLILNSKNSR